MSVEGVPDIVEPDAVEEQPQQPGMPIKQVMYTVVQWAPARIEGGPFPIVLHANTPVETLSFPLTQEAADAIAANIISVEGLANLLESLPPEVRAQVLVRQRIVPATQADVQRMRQGPTFKGV